MAEFKAICDMVRAAETHADDTSPERMKAIAYYNGEMPDLVPDKGRSSVVSRDVRIHIKKALPSIMRTMFAGDEVVEFQPVAQGDEQAAQQASDYINHVVFPEVGGRRIAYDAIHDALLLKNGILRWWWDERRAVKISKHSGLTEDELAQLDGEGEITESSERTEEVETPEGPQEITVYDVTLRREFTERGVKAAAVPRERFLMHPDATCIADSLLTGEKTEMTRSDLIAMGYDRERIMALSKADEDEDEHAQDIEDQEEADRANELVDYYDIYVRVDMDDDGHAELRHICMAGGLREENVLVDDECDEVQFCDICAMPNPHRFDGIALADDLMEYQKVRTALKRQTLDNLYWQNNKQPIVDLSAVENPDAVMNPEFGEPIFLKDGRRPQEVIQFAETPRIGAESMQMMEYLDQEAQDVTGVSDASAGLPPDALQNVTAKASAMMEAQGIGQTEMMVRNLAEGFRVFFRGLLRLTIRHQDKPRTIRLRDEWVQIDPRHWNAEMDATVNVGLGAGTRERDMQVVMQLMALQEKLLASFGPVDNPFVKAEHVSNALTKAVESMGLKSARMFFAEPDAETIARKEKEAKEQPNPEEQKMKADMQMKQAEMQMKTQLEQQKMQTQTAKEKAQMDADLTVKQAEIEAESVRQRQDLESKAALEGQRIAWEREKFYADLQVRQQEAAANKFNDTFREAAE